MSPTHARLSSEPSKRRSSKLGATGKRCAESVVVTYAGRIDRAQPLALEASEYLLGTHALALLAQLLHDMRPSVAAAAVLVDGGDLGVPRLVG